MSTWFSMKAAAAVAEMFIYDVIAEAKSFVRELSALSSTIRTVRVRINSPGGSPFAATAIANALREQREGKDRRVEVDIEGLAASAATLIPMAGSPARIANNAILMVHMPIGETLGQASDHRAMADALDRVADTMVSTYKWRSPLSRAELARLMAETTWMDAETAVAKGFATETSPAAPIEARHRPAVLAQLGAIPEQYRERIAALVAGRLPAASPANRPTAPTNVFDFYREHEEERQRQLAALRGA